MKQISNFSVVCAASRLMRLAMHRPSFDPESAPKPNVKVFVEKARKELASRQPSNIDPQQ